jgi:hypothetical protein
MLVIDENIPASQRRLLRKWRLHFRAIGIDVAASGTQDENLLPVLHRLSEPVFFTLDRDFFRRDWAHATYGLVWLDVADNESAEFVRRFLRHSTFDAQIKRLGVVARVRAAGVRFWRKGQRHVQSIAWRT